MTIDLILLLPVLAGSLLGRKLITMVDQPTFTKITVIIIMAGALFNLVNTLVI